MSRELARDRARREITRLLRENESPDYRLPSERDLAARIGVSRPSVREALRALTERDGLQTRQGAGTRTLGERPFLGAGLEALLHRTPVTLLELYETRELIEVFLAGRAAELRTPEDLATLEDALQALGAPAATRTEKDPADPGGPNQHFHLAIAAAARSPILADLVASLFTVIHARLTAAEHVLGSGAYWPVSYDIHREIFEAIRRGTVQDAQRAMTVHMGMAIAEIRQISE